MKTKTKTASLDWLRTTALRTARLHFIYVATYLAAVVTFDSWNLITHEGIVQRWTAAALLLALTTTIWFLMRSKLSSGQYYRVLVMILIAADVIFAAYNVFLQRGMASKAVALFAIPIITAGVLRSRRVVLAAASLSVAAYTFSAVKYFHSHYGEGFKVELYGEIGFYSAIFFILAGLILVIVNPKLKD